MVSAQTSEHEVPGSNPALGGMLLMTVHCTDSFIIIFPSSLYDSKNVERDVKQQSSSSKDLVILV